jgi:hypothetical protein
MKLVEVIPHPTMRGHWVVKGKGVLPPRGIWYKEKRSAVNYARWLARENHAEVRVHDEKPSQNRPGAGENR